jgi:hypothetical protein
LLRFGYHHLLSGLDVPPDPSATAVRVVRWFAIVAGVAQFAAGAILLARGSRR